MVDRQIRKRGVKDPRVLQAMLETPREAFVPEQHQGRAYDDIPLPIGHGQTISQPFTVAFMVEALGLTGDEVVLDVGAGSGYAAAVLAHLAREVYSVERIEPLAEEARSRLETLGLDNVTVHLGDGTAGLAEHAPYDGIVVAAGAPSLPQPLAQQLLDGGRLVIPIGATRRQQRLVRFTRRDNQWIEEDLGSFAFVPLIGQHSWSDAET